MSLPEKPARYPSELKPGLRMVMSFAISTIGASVSTVPSVWYALHNLSIGRSGTTLIGTGRTRDSFDSAKHTGKMLHPWPELVSRRTMAKLLQMLTSGIGWLLASNHLNIILFNGELAGSVIKR